MADKKVTEGNVVEDYYIGHCHIKICDDYCRDKTKEDVDKILKRIAEITLGPLQQAYLNEKDPVKRAQIAYEI